MMINRNAKTSLPRDARLGLTVIRDHLVDRQLATLVAIPVFEVVPEAPIDGFAATNDGGMSIFFVDASGVGEEGQWILQMCAVIAVDCKNVDQALLWANERNRRAAFDRYYCAMTQDRSMCAVAADTSMSSILMDSFLSPVNRPVVVALKSLAQNTLYTASEDADELAPQFAGRRLTTSDQDLMTLFAVASG